MTQKTNSLLEEGWLLIERPLGLSRGEPRFADRCFADSCSDENFDGYHAEIAHDDYFGGCRNVNGLFDWTGCGCDLLNGVNSDFDFDANDYFADFY